MVVGGGIIGASCAYYLRRAGARVTIVDKGKFGAACSHGNCGYICTSHVLPLAEPGAIGRTLKAMLRPNSPFTIKPRLDPALWRWLLAFAGKCNERDMLASGRALHPILESSLALYRQLVAEEQLNCEWEDRGLLFAWKSPVEFEAYGKTNDLLAREFHLPAEKLTGAALLEKEPALKPGLAGGWFYADDAHLRPDRLMSELRRLLEARGVAIREHCEFQGFTLEESKVRGAQCGGAEITADAFVVATGAWTPLLQQHLRCRVPIQPGKGYSITMPRPPVCPRVPMIFPETRVAVTPFQSGYRLGSTMEFAGYDSTINPARLKLLRDGAEPYLQTAASEPVEEEWWGWRPMTSDSLPVIDRAPVAANVFVAAGHSMLGLTLGAATGKLICELVSGQPPHVDVTPFSVRRFG
ncbi:MAG: FAD-dependent oxidoreductase [Planctomycetaceae bacterium]|nr:MAG: FAD-dependent oxidoreductase [Planctomycetaceae bacterium]